MCFTRIGKSLVRCLLLEAADQTWWKKLYLRSYLTQIIHSNGKKLFLQTNKLLLIKVSMARRSQLVFFYFKKKFCVSASVGKSLVRYLSLSVYTAFRPCQKKYISGYIWHKSFIQTVKYSFLHQIIARHSLSSRKRCLFWNAVPSPEVACLDRVCCMKMGLKRVSLVPFDKKNSKFLIEWQNLRFN